MDFIASLVSSLPWPGAVLLLVVYFRRSIVEAAARERLRRLKASTSGVELEFFDTQVQNIERGHGLAHRERFGPHTKGPQFQCSDPPLVTAIGRG